MGFNAGAGSQKSQGTSQTGATTSLSFLPALLSNAFFGTGIGVSEGGFQTLGGDENPTLAELRGTGLSKKQAKRVLAQQDPISQLNLGGDSLLNPNDLVSNLTDLLNPDSNPAIAGVLKGLGLGEQGADIANRLLTGDISSTLQEGLSTGFKPDLQPVIDEAKRGFFQDIVPQLGQGNVALQEGVGPFSTDLSGQLLEAGGDLSSQLGALEVGLQERAGDRKSNLLGISNLLTDQLFNANTDAARNRLVLGEQTAQLGTTGGRQASALAALAGLLPSNPIQANSSQQTGSGSQVSTGGTGGFSGK